MVAVMRAVVVLPLLPVITIFLALLAPTTDLSTLGSMRRAIMPGKLVPPPMRKKRPDAPASFPAEMARASRARPSPDGAVSSVPIKNLTIIISLSDVVRMQYSKPDYHGQVGRVLQMHEQWCEPAMPRHCRLAPLLMHL